MRYIFLDNGPTFSNINSYKKNNFRKHTVGNLWMQDIFRINTIQIMQPVTTYKTSALSDITNIIGERPYPNKKVCTESIHEMLPVLFHDKPENGNSTPTIITLQNKHPVLAMYNAHLVTETMSFNDLSLLCDDRNETQMLTFLTDLDILPDSQQCLNCKNKMRHSNKKKRGIGYVHVV